MDFPGDFPGDSPELVVSQEASPAPVLEELGDSPGLEEQEDSQGLAEQGGSPGLAEQGGSRWEDFLEQEVTLVAFMCTIKLTLCTCIYKNVFCVDAVEYTFVAISAKYLSTLITLC